MLEPFNDDELLIRKCVDLKLELAGLYSMNGRGSSHPSRISRKSILAESNQNVQK